MWSAFYGAVMGRSSSFKKWLNSPTATDGSESGLPHTWWFFQSHRTASSFTSGPNVFQLFQPIGVTVRSRQHSETRLSR